MAAQRQFLIVATSSKKPDDATAQKLYGATNDLVTKIAGLKDNRSKVANNLAAVAEGIAALQWVLVVCNKDINGREEREKWTFNLCLLVPLDTHPWPLCK